jgi:hypothetical protein
MKFLALSSWTSDYNVVDQGVIEQKTELHMTTQATRIRSQDRNARNHHAESVLKVFTAFPVPDYITMSMDKGKRAGVACDESGDIALIFTRIQSKRFCSGQDFISPTQNLNIMNTAQTRGHVANANTHRRDIAPWKPSLTTVEQPGEQPVESVKL